MDEDLHFELVQHSVAQHDAHEYDLALETIDRAIAIAPNCPSARYNKANTLHMLDRDDEARLILLDLVEASEQDLLEACPDTEEPPESVQLDAFYLLFHCTLYATDSWERALPYLREHLARRRPEVDSVWTRKAVLEEVEGLRREFAPDAPRVQDPGGEG